LSERQHAPSVIPGIDAIGGLHVMLPHMTGPGGGGVVGGFRLCIDPSPVGSTMAASLGPELLLAGGELELLHAAATARRPTTKLICTTLIFCSLSGVCTVRPEVVSRARRP
jgi:hypothetical protein